MFLARKPYKKVGGGLDLNHRSTGHPLPCPRTYSYRKDDNAEAQTPQHGWVELESKPKPCDSNFGVSLELGGGGGTTPHRRANWVCSQPELIPCPSRNLPSSAECGEGSPSPTPCGYEGEMFALVGQKYFVSCILAHMPWSCPPQTLVLSTFSSLR